MINKIQNHQAVIQENKVDINIIIVIVSTALLTFMGILSETGLNIAYSLLMSQFNVSASTVQWLTTGYLLVLSISIPVSPFLVKRFPTKRLFQTAVILFMLGTLTCSFSFNFTTLLLGRIIQAIGTSISLPLLVNIILEKVPIDQRGYLMGIVGLVTSFAPALGPTLGGMITELLNWHWIFIFMLPFLLASFIAGSSHVPNIQGSEKPSIDLFSILLSTVAFGGIVYGFSMSGNSKWSDPGIFCPIIIGIISMIIFVYRQLNLENPLIQVRIFRYSTFSASTLIVMLSMMCVLSIGFILPLFLQKSLKCSSMIAALAMLPGAIINGVMSPLTGKFLDKHGSKLLMITGFLLTTITLIVFSFNNNTFIMIVVTYAIFMFGASMLAMPGQTTGLNQLPQKYNSDGSAVINTLQQVSGAIGTAFASSILTKSSEFYLAEHSSTTHNLLAKSIKYGTQKSFSIILILSFLGLIVAVFSTRKSSKAH